MISRCRRWLPQRNAVHVCAPQVPVSAHFRGKSPVVRKLYEAARAAAARIGRFKTDSTKTRIAFRVWTNFLELTPQKNALRGCLVLPRRVEEPFFARVFSVSPRIHYHYFTLTDPKEVNARFRRWLREAFVVGRREHLRRPLVGGHLPPTRPARQPRRPAGGTPSHAARLAAGLKPGPTPSEAGGQQSGGARERKADSSPPAEARARNDGEHPRDTSRAEARPYTIRGRRRAGSE